MNAIAWVTVFDRILSLIDKGLMSAARAREVFEGLNARLQAARAEGREMTPQELQAFFAEGDIVLQDAFGSIADDLAALG